MKRKFAMRRLLAIKNELTGEVATVREHGDKIAKQRGTPQAYVQARLMRASKSGQLAYGATWSRAGFVVASEREVLPC
jgi:hypothetical protein